MKNRVLFSYKKFPFIHFLYNIEHGFILFLAEIINSQELIKEKSMISKKALCFLSLTILMKNVVAYDVVDRYKLIDDKLKTEAMLRPFGHDFLIDFSASINKNIMDVVDEAKVIVDSTKSDSQKLTDAQAFLTKYDKSEQSARFGLNLGIPIFSFTAGDVTVRPNLRVMLDVGTNIGIRSEILTADRIIALFSEEIPTEFQSLIRVVNFTTCNANDGTPSDNKCDIVAYCRTQPSGISAATAAYCSTQSTGKYMIPISGEAVPNLALFAKVDGKVGLFNDFKVEEHFFGNLNIYGLLRTDILQTITSEAIAKGQKIELPKKQNTETTLQTDLKLGYKNTNYAASLGVEEIKLSKIKEREDGSREQSYGYDPLIRFHADALYKLSVLSLNPFIGAHKRSGYAFADGVYAGADLGAHIWGDRLGLLFRGMVDKQYVTVGPRIKLWLMQLEYSLKSPLKSTDGYVKLSALHSLDFRLFF